jgi:hypothetical protein
MKQLIIALMLVAIPTIYNAQTLSSSRSDATKEKQIEQEKKHFEENSVEVFVEIEVEEYYRKDQIEIVVNLGKSYQKMISEKDDYIMFEKIEKDVSRKKSITDILNYFSGRGFKVVNISILDMNDFILNKIIVSKLFITEN